MILSAPEAEFYVNELTLGDLEEIGSTKWLLRHERLEKLNMQATIQSMAFEDEFVKDLFVSYEKIPILIQNVVVQECWMKYIFPHIVEEVDNSQVSFQISIVLHHQLTLSGLLEIFFYHADCCQSAEEILPDLVDFCHRQIITILQWTPEDKKQNGIPNSDGASENLHNQAKKVQFQTGIKAMSILCHVIENLTELPLGIRHRLLTVHDTIMLLLHLLENPPWKYRSDDDDGLSYVYVGNKWNEEQPMKIEKCEAQVWIALLRLIADSENFRKYDLNDYKKAQILKLRSKLTDVFLDQMPSLLPLRRLLEELVLFNPQPAKKDLIMEQISVVFESLQRKYDGKWKSVAAKQLKSHFSLTPEAIQEQAKTLSELYNMETLENFLEARPKCAFCGNSTAEKCDRCGNEWYCSQSCQSQHWPRHKSCCDMVMNEQQK